MRTKLVTLLGVATMMTATVAVARDFFTETLVLNNKVHTYAVYVPETDVERVPVVLFLHGAGERGQDLKLATSLGLDRFLPHAEDALIVAPQVNSGGWWTDPGYMKLAMAALEDAISEYRGDRNRIYIAGISMGGHGALHLTAAYPDTFAAALIMCARVSRPNYLNSLPNIDIPVSELAQKLNAVPLWMFHGEADPIVPVRNARKLYRALRSKAAPANYTELANADHNIWNTVMGDPAVADWLLSHSRHQPIPEV